MAPRRRRMGSRLWVPLLLLAALSLPAGLLPAPAQAAGPDLRLRPDEGAVGASIRARGRNFSPRAEGSVTWGDDASPLAAFVVAADGEFEVVITVPDVPPGDHRVVGTSGDVVADDAFSVEAEAGSPTTASTPPPAVTEATPPALSAVLQADPCGAPARRVVGVSNAAALTDALADARAGDRIDVARGAYTGNFVATGSGSADERIALCGAPAAVLDGGGWEQSGYALHITGDFWTIHGLTITDAQKGVMLDDADVALLDGLDVHTIGHEAVHFRTHSSDGVVQNSDIHDTGLDNEKFGEGVYLGTSVSNWEKYTAGEPDRSDRNRVLRNRFWNTSSESIDIKEGTEGGLIEANVFDGATMSGADSWVDVKGNGYLIRANVGTNSPQDGFQTHVIDNLGWGTDNVFEANDATVNAAGFGFYIHQPDSTANTVRCDNVVNAAAAGVSNLPELCSQASKT